MGILTYHHLLHNNNYIEHVHPIDYHNIHIRLRCHSDYTNHNDMTNIVYNRYIVNHKTMLLYLYQYCDIFGMYPVCRRLRLLHPVCRRLLNLCLGPVCRRLRLLYPVCRRLRLLYPVCRRLRLLYPVCRRLRLLYPVCRRLLNLCLGPVCRRLRLLYPVYPTASFVVSCLPTASFVSCLPTASSCSCSISSTQCGILNT